MAQRRGGISTGTSVLGLPGWIAITAVAGARVALIMFVIQLALNVFWAWLFFAWHQGALAFLDVLLLWAAVAMTMNLFRRVRPVAGTLMIPYLAWVSFAVVLTYAAWKANPGVL
jgi:tryptophan-rich sensory protein